MPVISAAFVACKCRRRFILESALGFDLILMTADGPRPRTMIYTVFGSRQDLDDFLAEQAKGKQITWGDGTIP